MTRRKRPGQFTRWFELDAEDILSQYPPEYLDCREGGHAWERRAIWVLIAPGVLERQTTCMSCGSVAFEEVDAKTYRRLSPQRKIRYATGYQTAKTGLVRDDFRSTSYGRDVAAAMKSNRFFDHPEGSSAPAQLRAAQ